MNVLPDDAHAVDTTSAGPRRPRTDRTYRAEEKHVVGVVEIEPVRQSAVLFTVKKGFLGGEDT